MIKSEIWFNDHCSGLGNETMVCVVFYSIFYWYIRRYDIVNPMMLRHQRDKYNLSHYFQIISKKLWQYSLGTIDASMAHVMLLCERWDQVAIRDESEWRYEYMTLNIHGHMIAPHDITWQQLHQRCIVIIASSVFIHFNIINCRLLVCSETIINRRQFRLAKWPLTLG